MNQFLPLLPMDKILTTPLTVGNSKNTNNFTLDNIISTVKEWVLRKRENEFGDLDFSHEINRWRKDRCYVSILNFTDEEKRHFTMRYAHPGFNDTDEFITDIVLLQNDEIFFESQVKNEVKEKLIAIAKVLSDKEYMENKNTIIKVIEISDNNIKKVVWPERSAEYKRFLDYHQYHNRRVIFERNSRDPHKDMNRRDYSDAFAT